MPHGEGGADGAHARIADDHDEGPRRILGDIEQGFAATQVNGALFGGELHIDAARGVQVDDAAVVERDAQHFALAGRIMLALSQEAEAHRPDRRRGERHARAAQKRAAIEGGSARRDRRILMRRVVLAWLRQLRPRLLALPYSHR